MNSRKSAPKTTPNKSQKNKNSKKSSEKSEKLTNSFNGKSLKCIVKKRQIIYWRPSLALLMSVVRR